MKRGIHNAAFGSPETRGANSGNLENAAVKEKSDDDEERGVVRFQPESV